MTLAGKVTSLAGTGDYFEFKSRYEPAKPQKSDTVQLVATRRIQTAGSNVFLGYKDGIVYFSAADATPHVERLYCK